MNALREEMVQSNGLGEKGVENRDSGKEIVRRTRRRDNGRALNAGLADPPTRDSFSRTLALVRAALKAWETRHPTHEEATGWRTRKP